MSMRQVLKPPTTSCNPAPPSMTWDARHGPVRWRPTRSFGDRLRHCGRLQTSPYSLDWKSSMAGNAEEEETKGTSVKQKGLSNPATWLSSPSKSAAKGHSPDTRVHQFQGDTDSCSLQVCCSTDPNCMVTPLGIHWCPRCSSCLETLVRRHRQLISRKYVTDKENEDLKT